MTAAELLPLVYDELRKVAAARQSAASAKPNTTTMSRTAVPVNSVCAFTCWRASSA